MGDLKKIKSALISVYHKDRVDEIVKKLQKLDVKIYSTGGTKTFIEELGVNVTAVEELTTYPSILGGRVKTLHPKVFGGILGRRELDSDKQEMAKYNIPDIDLVVVDLYPFEETVANTDEESEIIERRERKAREDAMNAYNKVTLSNLFEQMEHENLKQLNIIVKAEGK